MPIFLAPVPVSIINGVLSDQKEGGDRFAFGTRDDILLSKKDEGLIIPQNCEDDNWVAYLYVSKTGIADVPRDGFRELGIWFESRLCGWVEADRRTGAYPEHGTAKRPKGTGEDFAVRYFWEVDRITKLKTRIPVTDFYDAKGIPFKPDFAPHHPMVVSRKD